MLLHLLLTLVAGMLQPLCAYYYRERSCELTTLQQKGMKNHVIFVTVIQEQQLWLLVNSTVTVVLRQTVF